MNNVLITDIQNYIEENSRYRDLLEERFINKERYTTILDSICKGLTCLSIPEDTIAIFKNKANFIICLGYDLTEYKGCELPLYIGYKKMGLPISDEIKKKCPKQIISIVEYSSSRQYLDEFQAELKKISFSPDIFLSVHKSILNARAEKLLSNLLSDIKRLSFTSINDALQKIPSVYLNYLSSDSLAKLKRKISTDLRDVRNKLEEELRSIELYSMRMKEQLQELYLETSEGLKDIVENELQRGVDLDTITHKASNLFSRLDRLFLGNIYHLRDYQKRKRDIQQFLKQGENIETVVEEKVTTKRKKISDIYSDYTFFGKFGPLTPEEEKTFSKMLVQELEQMYRTKSQDIPLLQKFEKKGLLSVQLEYNDLRDSYNSFMKQVLVPQYIGQCLLEIVTCLPPVNEPQRVINDLANLSLLSFESNNILYVVKGKKKYPKSVVNFIDPYRACATVLIYDIRGSSYMGIKLHNAAKEQKIKYKFAKEMAEIVKKYDGFLLKDTGDGGLVWFSENSGSLYKHLYTESMTGKGMKLRYSIFSGAEFKLIPAVDAAKRAILCARDMVLRAEEFIRANFMHYREWFADVAERTLELDGITYALLPPEFKSLFRIGIGIASGTPDKDVVLAANSYGDPDLVGPILSDAHLYSMERQPGRSVITCDLPSLINVILNIESFDYPVDETEFEKYIKSVGTVREKEHSYKFSDLKITIEPKGIHILEELDKKKALVGKHSTELLLDEHGNLYNEHKKKIKLIYEVLNIS